MDPDARTRTNGEATGANAALRSQAG